MNAHRLKNQRKKTRGHLLTGRNDGVVFARVVDVELRTFSLRGILNPADQLIGLARHRRYDDCYLVASVNLTFDVSRHIADAGDVGDRSPTEFHHYARHGNVKSLLSGPRTPPPENSKESAKLMRG